MKLLIRKLIIIWDELRFCWMVLFLRNIRHTWANQSTRSIGLIVKSIAHKLNLENSDEPMPAIAFTLSKAIIFLFAEKLIKERDPQRKSKNPGCYYRVNISDVKVEGKKAGDWILVVKQLKKKEKRR